MPLLDQFRRPDRGTQPQEKIEQRNVPETTDVNVAVLEECEEQKEAAAA